MKRNHERRKKLSLSRVLFVGAFCGPFYLLQCMITMVLLLLVSFNGINVPLYSVMENLASFGYYVGLLMTPSSVFFELTLGESSLTEAFRFSCFSFFIPSILTSGFNILMYLQMV